MWHRKKKYEINIRTNLLVVQTFVVLLNPLTAGAVYIGLLHFLLAHYISVFKPVKDKKWH